MQTRATMPRWITIAAILTLVFGVTPATWGQSRAQVLTNPTVNLPSASDVSIPLRNMPRVTPSSAHAVHPALHPKLNKLALQGFSSAIPNASTSAPVTFPTGGLVAATLGFNFDGVDQSATMPAGPDLNSCDNLTNATVAPPDTNAAVGDTQIVEWVNTCYAVFDKATGALVAGPFAGTQFWQGFGRGCQTSNDGDPIIQWDKLAHRWVAFQNIFSYPYETCIAVSTTADATGSYYRYVYNQLQGFPDYPKIGIMPDAFYQTQNNFGVGGAAFAGVTVCAYERAKILNGAKNPGQVCFVDNANGTLFDDSMVPADLDSPDHPPTAGQPEVLLGSIDNATSGSNVYEYLFHVDWKKPSRSTLTGVAGSIPISVPSYQIGVCTSAGALTISCVPAPPVYDPQTNLNITVPLDTLGDRLMYRLAYRSDGTTQRWVITHTVNDTSATAVRWYQFSAPQGSTGLALAQSGQTADDGEFRWMGSAAMDKAGDVAIGYSRSSATAGDFPSIYYSGQSAGEPAGTTDAESLIYAGLGSAVSVGRWGDYTSMAIDASDGCTFLYANEYLPANDIQIVQGATTDVNGGGWSWRTRLAKLKFPNCQ